jgi:hypothetical protein
MSPAPKIENIPIELQSRPQWVMWRYETRDGKRTKPPRQVNGDHARVNDPSTWTDFNTACGALKHWAGLGYVFAAEDGLVGIDLDHCVDVVTGEVADWAADILSKFTNTYIEYSPSGEGFHVLCKGKALLTGQRKWKAADGQQHGIEVYDYRSPRYFTVSGDAFNHVPLSDCQESLEWLYERFYAEKQEQAPANKELDEEALFDALRSIDSDDYQTWIKVGMALKSGGYPCSVWDDWSAQSPKYRPGDCDRKWRSFKGSGVGVGSIFHLAGKRFIYREKRTPRVDSQIQSFAPGGESEDDYHVREWPTLQPAALHGLAGRIVEASVESSEADPAAVLATLLVRAGATFGRHSWTKIGDDRHYPLLFGMVVGASANARKGTSLGPIERIFDDAEARLAIPPLRVSNGLSSGEGLIATIRDAKAATKDEDADEGVSDKRVLVIESEFAGALKAMQRQGNTLSVVIRDAWDRRKLSIMTKNNPLQASEGHIGLLGHITKNELARQLEKVELSNGLVNRFLWFCSRRSKILAFPEGLSEEILPYLASDLSKAIYHGQREQCYHFDLEAAEYYRHLYHRVTTSDVGGLIGDITARGPAQIRRLALIYSILDLDSIIRLHHLQAANAVWEYCLASARWIFGTATTEHAPARSLNEKLLDALSIGETSQTELNRKFKNTCKASALAQALAELQALGRITQRQGEGSGGRAPVLWSLVEVR